MMKKLQIFGLWACMILSLQLNAQLVYNNGTGIKLNQDVSVFVYGSVQNESGQIDVDAVSGQSELLIQADFINNDIAGGDGYYRVLGDWFNNSIFNAGSGTVFLEGDAQTLGGSASTTFNNLTLDGSGIKTQAIDQYCNGILSLNDIELNTDVHGFFMQNTDVNAITLGTGFVSSLDGGFLSRATNTASDYLFPVGSSLGTSRYRPVEITPDGTGNTFTVRMANTDATSEGYDVNAFETGICEINPLFYHQIDRTAGTSAVDMRIYYDDAADGDWDGIVNWNTGNAQWEIVPGSFTASGSPLFEAFTTGWGDFSDIPYALYTASPSTPVVDVDCSGGADNGIIEVTAPIGAEYEYTIDGTYQDSTTFGPLTNGSYTVTVMNTTTGCTAAGSSVNLDCGCLNPTLLTLSSNSGSTCNLSPVIVSGNTFGGSATEVYLSHDGSGLLDATTISASPFDFTYTPNPADEGYDVTITVETDNPEGVPCISSLDTYVLTVYPIPVATATSNSPLCEGEDIILNGAPSGESYNWDGPDGFTSTLEAPTITSTTTAADGTYNLTVTDGNGCSATASTNVTVNPTPPTPTVSTDCTGGADNGIITVTAPIGTDYEYSIDGNYQSDTVFGPLTDGTYTVTVMNTTTGCTSEGNIIDLDCGGCADPPTLSLNSNSYEVCGANPVTISGNTFGGSATEVNLSHDGSGTLDTTTITSSPFEFTYTPDPADAGSDITITVTTDNPSGAPCIPAGETFTLTVHPLPNVVAGSNSPVYEGEDINLTENGGDADSWTWSGPDAFVSTDQNPTVNAATVLADGLYSVTVTDINGCTGYDSTIIVVSPEQIEDLHIPDVITPNGDAYNETWEIQGIEAYDEITIFIFNRWGDEVFSFKGSGSSYTEIHNQWNGMWKDKELPFGTYFYVLELNNENYKGTITLIR
ncbi:MAG: gliding motility-associated C-terminal domain-containing protein [Bacteroidota bacterium]|nr:gliding motility-associated C-terminal domain-containing protein [Bacteroidota bacterium]